MKVRTLYHKDYIALIDTTKLHKFMNQEERLDYSRFDKLPAGGRGKPMDHLWCCKFCSHWCGNFGEVKSTLKECTITKHYKQEEPEAGESIKSVKLKAVIT